MTKQIAPFDPSLMTDGIIHTNGINANEQLMLYNDSAYGLKLTFNDNTVDILPAGWNKDFIQKQAMGDVRWSLYNQLLNTSNYPMSQVYGVLYEVEERVTSVNASMQRGFAITNQGGVQVSQNSFVSQGSTPGSVVEQISSSANPSNVCTLTSDGLYYLAVTIAAVLVQVIKTNEVDPILQLGSLGYTVETLGKLLVDQLATFNAGFTASGGDNTISSGLLINGKLANTNYLQCSGFKIDTNGNLTNTGGLTQSGQVIATNVLNSIVASVLRGTVNLPLGKLGFAADGDILDASGATIFIKNRVSGKFDIQSPDGNTIAGFNTAGVTPDGIGANGTFGVDKIFLSIGSVKAVNTGTVTTAGSVTVNHGLSGTPSAILVCPDTAGSTATFSASSYTTTQFTLLNGSGVSQDFRWYGYR